MTFWGLILEPEKHYSQVVETPFHVSMATLDVSTHPSDVVQVKLGYEGRQYLLCNLKAANSQTPLDLNFGEGSEITFSSVGNGRVHLTGYLVDDMEDSFDEEMEEEEEEEEEVPQLVNGKKRKNQPAEGNKLKRVKKADSDEDDDEEDDDDDDEDDDDDDDDEDEEDDAQIKKSLANILGKSFEDSSDEGDDSFNIGSDEDDDSDEDNDDSDEAEPEKPVKSKKKEKQQKKTQEKPAEVSPPLTKSQKKKQKKQQNQQNKQNMTNGDAKPEGEKQPQGKKEAKEGKEEKKTQKKDKKQQKEQPQKQEDKQQQNNQKQQESPRKKTLQGGLLVEDTKVGNGPVAKSGQFATVYYVGKLKNGKKFDSSTSGNGFKFRLGQQEVIKGWDVGIQGMKVGGKRKITIPPSMGYGAKGSPPAIPPNSWLIFEVELKKVN